MAAVQPACRRSPSRSRIKPEVAGGTPYEDTVAVPSLAPGASAALTFSVPATSLGAGSFVAGATLRLSGSTLASTTASFTVSSSALLIGTLSLPVAIRRGGSAAANVVLTNVGTLPSVGQTATVEFIDRTTGALAASQNSSFGPLAPGLSFQAAFAPATSGWPVGPYVANLSVNEQGIVTRLASVPFELIDGAPPTLTLLAPAQGSVVGANLAVQLRAEDDSAGVGSVLVSVDSGQGLPLTLATGTALSGFWVLQLTGLSDGPHLLTFTALDGEGNAAAPLSTLVVVDASAPVVQLVGVSDGASYDVPVTPSWIVTDPHLASVAATLDGQPFVAGSLISGEGQHRLEVVAFDTAGNFGRASAVFEVDTQAPTLTLAGVSDGLVSSQTVIPRVTATDRNLASFTLTLNGAAFVSGTSISAEGEYVLEAVAVDQAGHQQCLSIHFSIDRTPPTVWLTGFVEGAATKVNVTPVVNATDLHLLGVRLVVNGVELPVGSTIRTEGVYLVSATAIDAAGNQASVIGHFTIDRTGPVVVILGVTAGSLVSTPVFPTIQTEPGAALIAELDGSMYPLGTAISAEGAHLLVATAVDAAGNSGTAQVSFTVDLTAPVITFAGLADGSFYAAPISAQAFATDAHPPVVITLSLDGQPSSQGALVQSEGPHTLSATATDAAGNISHARANFTLDFTAPVLTVSGVAPNGISATAVTLTWSAADASPVTFTARLDGQHVVSPVLVNSEGPHALSVTATDAAGNATTKALSFELDFTAPVITITGVSAGSYVSQPVTVTFTATDPRLVSVRGTLDGAPISSGATVAAEGAHELVVIATDSAGNNATRRVGFTIDRSAPVITITGVTEGAVGLSFSPAFVVTDATAVTVTAQLDGVVFTSGSLVQTPGAHTLVVSVVDAAGNRSSKTVHFTISGQTLRPSFHYAACGLSSVRLDNGSQVRGVGGATASVASNGWVRLENNAQVVGDIVSGGDLTLLNNAYASGRGYYGGRLTLGSHASLAQGSTLLSAPVAPCDCGFDVASALAGAAAHNDNQLLAGMPAFIGGRLVVTSGTVTLPAGRYFFSSLEVRTNARLTAAPGATVELYVSGAVQVRNNAFMGAIAGSPSLLVVSGASGTTPVELKNNTVGSLLLYAPQAWVELQNNVALNGAVVGRDVHLSNNQTLVLDGFTQLTPPLLVCQ